MTEFESLARNAELLRERVRAACKAAGRSEEEITVVAATKCVPADIVARLPEVGIRIAGENRVQEFVSKYGCNSDLDWHVIGGLQTNKVKYAVGKVSLIQSVDRTPLAAEIDRLSARAGVVSDVLIEVNIGEEPAKSGVLPSGLDELTEYLKSCRNIRLRGLMAVPPIGAERGLYERMRQLHENVRAKYGEADILSMGMSDDYETAISCGANMIRIGRALFGPRVYAKKNNA